MARVRHKWEETELLYDGIQYLLRLSWMAQPFNPSIVEKGELRAFVVAGKMVHVIHMLLDLEGGTQCQEFMNNLMPLSLLK